MRRFLSCNKNRFASGLLVGVLLYLASTMNNDALIDLGGVLGSPPLLASTAPSAPALEIA